MDRRIGFALIVIGILIAAISAVDMLNSEKLVNIYSKEAGTCYIGDTCLHEQNNLTFLILLIIASAIIIIGALITVLSPSQPATKKIEKPKSLNNDEAKIFDILKASGGSMLQGEIVLKSGMAKAKISRLMDKLEMKGVIERRRHGMSNIIILKANE